MNILRILIFVTLFCNGSCSNRPTSEESGYFEGIVTYKGDFIRKTDEYDSATLASLAGGRTTLYAKEGNYLTEIEEGITTRMLYRKDENKAYRETFDSDSVYWAYCDGPRRKIINFVVNKNVEKILDIECDEFKVFYENRTVTYYYNSDTLKINPDWAKKSTSFNEDFYARRMKAIWLKIVIEYKDFVVSNTAIKIVPQRITNSIFEIPDKPLAEEK